MANKAKINIVKLELKDGQEESPAIKLRNGAKPAFLIREGGFSQKLGRTIPHRMYVPTTRNVSKATEHDVVWMGSVYTGASRKFQPVTSDGGRTVPDTYEVWKRTDAVTAEVIGQVYLNGVSAYKAETGNEYIGLRADKNTNWIHPFYSAEQCEEAGFVRADAPADVVESEDF